MGIIDWIIGGGLTAFLFGVVSWIGKKWMAKMEEITTAMGKNITSMEKLIAVMENSVKTHNEIIEKQLSEHHKILENHDERIRTHGDRIARVETRCKVYHNQKEPNED